MIQEWKGRHFVFVSVCVCVCECEWTVCVTKILAIFFFVRASFWHCLFVYLSLTYSRE